MEARAAEGRRWGGEQAAAPPSFSAREAGHHGRRQSPSQLRAAAGTFARAPAPRTAEGLGRRPQRGLAELPGGAASGGPGECAGGSRGCGGGRRASGGGRCVGLPAAVPQAERGSLPLPRGCPRRSCRPETRPPGPASPRCPRGARRGASRRGGRVHVRGAVAPRGDPSLRAGRAVMPGLRRRQRPPAWRVRRPGWPPCRRTRREPAGASAVGVGNSAGVRVKPLLLLRGAGAGHRLPASGSPAPGLVS